MGIVNVSMNFSGSWNKQNETIPGPLCNQFLHLYDSDHETWNAGLYTVGQEEK